MTPETHEAAGPRGPAEVVGRTLGAALWTLGGLGLLAGGLLLWRERAELVFVDMVASAFAMCF